MPEMPAQIGPYTIHEKLGAGGMGTVYLGRHVTTGMMAAVKVLPASMAQEEGFVERFNREIESMKRLNNPHIVRLYENGDDHGTYYYSMEYVPGETLTALLRREKRVPWPQAIEMTIQICQALKAAHDNGIIHRDLKPSNLLVAPDGTIKLTDFGVAQVFATGRLTVTGGIVGTAEFMSPEQAEGKRATKQSDLYSLGAVLYSLVTGRPPFSGTTAVDVLQKHRFGRFDRPQLVVPDIPRWLDEITCQLLEKDPAKRFPDAYVLARRLDQVSKKVELSQESPTAAIIESDGTEATIVAGSPESLGAGPATLMKHLVRAELEELNRGSVLSEFLNHLWVQISLLILLFVGGVFWFYDWELSPEQKFERAVALLKQPEGPDWFRARDEYLQPLVESAPEQWSERAAPYLREVELYQLKRNTARPGSRKQPAAPQSEAERFLLRAQTDRAAGDHARAAQTLTALISLLAGDPEREKLYDLATRLRDEWRAADGLPAGRYTWLVSALARAQARADENQLEEARAIWKSIVELYQADPDAAEYVQQAQQALNTKAETDT